MANQKKYRGWVINAPSISVGSLNNADHQRYLFNQTIAQMQQDFASLKRANYRSRGSDGYTNYDTGGANTYRAQRSTNTARDIVNRHVTKEIKRKGLLKGKKDVRVYHTAWTGSPAVRYKDKTGKRKAYVNVRGL